VRSFIGWVCGVALAFAAIGNPLIVYWTGNAGVQIPVDVIHSLLIALLGLGGYRTVEKLKGRSK
jgi:hypothetical protein